MIAKRVVERRERQKRRHDNVVPGKKMNITKLLRTKATDATSDNGANDHEMSVNSNSSDSNDEE